MTDIKAKDSVVLQTISLLQFAEALGYRDEVSPNGRTVVFQAVKRGLEKHNTISVSSMILLHNGLKSDRVNNAGTEQLLEVGGRVFTLPTYYVRRARGAKMVDKVDLRLTREGGNFLFTSEKDWVKFVNNSYPVAKQLLGVVVENEII